jgi:hypothetical protein
MSIEDDCRPFFGASSNKPLQQDNGISGEVVAIPVAAESDLDFIIFSHTLLTWSSYRKLIQRYVIPIKEAKKTRGNSHELVPLLKFCGSPPSEFLFACAVRAVDNTLLGVEISHYRNFNYISWFTWPGFHSCLSQWSTHILMTTQKLQKHTGSTHYIASVRNDAFDVAYIDSWAHYNTKQTSCRFISTQFLYLFSNVPLGSRASTEFTTKGFCGLAEARDWTRTRRVARAT